MTTNLIIDAGWIVTVDPQDTVLTDHSLIIKDGLIDAIVPQSEAMNVAPEALRLDRKNHILLPGLINTHTHLAMNLLRGFADDLPLMTWLQEHIWKAEGKWVDSRFVADGSELAIAESLLGGVTCLNDMYFFPDEVAKASSAAGIRATVGLIVLEFPTVWAKDANEYLAKGFALNDELRDNPLVTTTLAPHAPYTVSRETLARIHTYSAELDLPVHMHVHETAAEVENFVAEHGKRPLTLLDELGLLNPSLLAVHMTQLDASEIEKVAECGANVLHSPESNLKLASGHCPVGELLKQDVNVSIGTDGAASNNDIDMFGEMRTAALLAKINTGDASEIPASTALRMATINGARALGLDTLTGSLEVGKAADCITVSVNSVDMVPMYSPMSHLVYCTDRNKVNDVWVGGRQLVENRNLLTLDEAEIIAKAKNWGTKIAAG